MKFATILFAAGAFAAPLLDNLNVGKVVDSLAGPDLTNSALVKGVDSITAGNLEEGLNTILGAVASSNDDLAGIISDLTNILNTGDLDNVAQGGLQTLLGHLTTLLN